MDNATARQREAVERRLRESESGTTEPKAKSGDRPDDYEVVEVSGGRRLGGIVSVQLDADDMELLVGLAEASGESLSGTPRMGLHCLIEQG